MNKTLHNGEMVPSASMTEVRRNLVKLSEWSNRNNKAILITSHGKPTAYLVGIKYWNKLQKVAGANV